ncbi:ABC transporter ATP-binding protein, partial [Lacticaseibacillus rhamnosus]
MKQLEIAHLDKAFDQQVLFKDANYTFKQGKIYGLLGRNGSGKSTLFNMIVRNLPHDHGTIAIDADDGQGLITDYADTSVGMVYTQPHLPAFMTGVEFVDYFMAINRQRLEQTHTSVKAAD